MRDLTQQILNKLISTSTGDINGKIIDLYDKMNSVYNDLASTSTSYTKGKIADLYTKMNNIYNELNSTSTSYMKGKINSIYSKVMTSGDEEEFVPNFNCNRLVATSRDENIYSVSKSGLKCILNFKPPKTAIYRIQKDDNNYLFNIYQPFYDKNGMKYINILNGLNDRDFLSYNRNNYLDVKNDIQKQNFFKDIKLNEFVYVSAQSPGSFNNLYYDDYRYISDIYYSGTKTCGKKNDNGIIEIKQFLYSYDSIFGSVYIVYKNPNEIYMKLYKNLNLVISRSGYTDSSGYEPNFSTKKRTIKVYSS